MGFREDIEAIADCLKPPSERQTFMFSATMAKNIQQVARATLSRNHKFINCVPDDAAPTHLQIPQYYSAVSSPKEQIPHVLRLIAEDQLANPGKSKVLIFFPTTRMVQLYSTLISQIGEDVLPAGENTRFAEMHSKKAMNSRVKTSEWFRRDTSGASVMLTSDVSARGVDYPGVTRVIQVGTPANGETYVHRVGRTGRGSNMSGRADLVLLPWELDFLKWQLSDIPVKELTPSQLKEQVGTLAEQYDANPAAFFHEHETRHRRNSPRKFRPGVAERVTEGSIAARIEAIQPEVSSDDVHDALVSMLAFYASNAAALRVPREAAVDGVHDWAAALTGEPMRLRVPKEFMTHRAPARSSRPSRSGSGFGSGGRDRRSDGFSYRGRDGMSSRPRYDRGDREDRGDRGGEDRGFWRPEEVRPPRHGDRWQGRGSSSRRLSG